MYAQALNAKDLAPVKDEDPEKLAAFQARIDAEEKIEPNDWMPEQYRRTLIRQISQHAHSEVIGMQPEGNWVTRAPTLKRKAQLLAKIQDEAGHGLYLYSAAETLGVSREELLPAASLGPGQIFVDLQLPDADLRRHGRGRLARGRRGDHEPDPPVPLQLRSLRPGDDPASAGRKSFHQRQGYEIMLAMARGTAAQRAMAQDALNRFWWPSLMMFGPHNTNSVHSEQSMKWKIKRFTNDGLRQKFIDATVPQARYLGPDDPGRRSPR